MAYIKISRISRLILVAIAIGVADQAVAEKPSWAGGDKHEKHSKKEQHNDPDGKIDYYSGQKYFSDRHRTAVRGYFDSYTQSGRCPPGLAKKNNGCMPPGQAKKWAIGQPLQHDMAYSNLSADLARSLGLPPQGYQYVQSASDILLINGAGIVMDAINNWGR